MKCPKGHDVKCPTGYQRERYKKDPSFKNKQDAKTMAWYWKNKVEKPTEKAKFRCPLCKKIVERVVVVGRKSLKSICESVGDYTRLIRIKEKV